LQRSQKLSKAYEKMYERPESLIQARLLPGELAIGHAKKVLCFIDSALRLHGCENWISCCFC